MSSGLDATSTACARLYVNPPQDVAWRVFTEQLCA